jgi:hypothetical protein
MSDASNLGRRIAVVGPVCSGKSTLAALLAERLGMPFVELDALFWLPDWTESDDETFGAKVAEATAGDEWAVAGSYNRISERLIWPRTETAIWLDFSLPLVLRRLLVRSWRRWRNKELLWGTSFWSQFYRRNALLFGAMRFQRGGRRRWVRRMADPGWSHVNFVRLRSPAELERWLAKAVPAA